MKARHRIQTPIEAMAPAARRGFPSSGPLAAVRRLSRIALDALLPPQCLACGSIVNELGVLCAPCWEALVFLGPPQCVACGLPFAYPLGDGALCVACGRERPAYHRARAALAYDGGSRSLVLSFKHGDRTDAAPAFGRWLVRAGGALVAEAEVVAPVPLHWTRMFARRYNQAALLADVVGRLGGTPVIPDLLVRRRRTRPLGRLGPAARRRVLNEAFALSPSRAAAIEGRRVLLVDDVLTTGTTVSVCARTLQDGGAGAVDVLTLARVVRPDSQIMP